MKLVALTGLSLAACGAPAPQPTTPPPPPPQTTAPAGPTTYTTSTIALPGAGSDGVGMDGLAYDARTNTVWVPAGNTASVDVIDAASGNVIRLHDFATREMERRGTKRTVGPSAAAVGDGVVYIASRGDSSVCAIDEHTLARGACGALDAMPDAVAYVAPTHEVWVTTPRDKSLRVLDATTLAQKAKIELAEGPEGAAVDPLRHRFYTNFEEGDATLVIDLTTHATLATWKPSCGAEGPHGLALDVAAGVLLVACEASIVALAVDHDGQITGRLPAGTGLDDFDYAPATHLVYAGATSGSLTIARVQPDGSFAAPQTVPTPAGSRNGVVDSAGKVYLAHGKAGEIVVVAPEVKAR